MNFPEGLKYSKSHEWVNFLSDSAARVGITDFAQAHMGDIVYVRLPENGSRVTSGAPLTDIESVKAVADVFSPVTGDIARVNEALDDAPETINATPYEAWICEVSGIAETEDLMDAAEYRTFCETEEH